MLNLVLSVLQLIALFAIFLVLLYFALRWKEEKRVIRAFPKASPTPANGKSHNTTFTPAFGVKRHNP